MTQPPRSLALPTVTVSIGAVMASISGSSLNVAFPALANDFHVPAAIVAWVSIVFTLVSASLLTIFGRLSDMAGRKRMYAAGVAVYIIFSMLCGASRNIALLITFRALQGVGSAMVNANSMAYLIQIYPPNRRGFVVGWWEACIGAGQALGPVIGGVLIGAFGWPAVFFINLPFGIAILAMVPRYMFEPPRRSVRQQFDFVGAALFGAAVATLLFGLTEAYDLGWSSFIISGCLGVSLACSIGFVLTELRAGQPMIDLSMFRSWTFGAGCAAKIFGYLPFSAHTFLLPFYLEEALGLTPETVGFLLTPLPVGLVAGSAVFGPLSDRIGTRKLAPLGLFLIGVGSAIFTRVEPAHGLLVVFLAALLAGAGLGAFIAPNDSSILSATPRNRLGVANGLMGVSRQLGTILGLSIGAGLLSARLVANHNALVPSFHQVYAVVTLVAFAGIGFAVVRGGRPVGLATGAHLSVEAWPIPGSLESKP